MSQHSQQSRNTHKSRFTNLNHSGFDRDLRLSSASSSAIGRDGLHIHKNHPHIKNLRDYERATSVDTFADFQRNLVQNARKFHDENHQVSARFGQEDHEILESEASEREHAPSIFERSATEIITNNRRYQSFADLSKYYGFQDTKDFKNYETRNSMIRIYKIYYALWLDFDLLLSFLAIYGLAFNIQIYHQNFYPEHFPQCTQTLIEA